MTGDNDQDASESEEHDPRLRRVFEVINDIEELDSKGPADPSRRTSRMRHEAAVTRAWLSALYWSLRSPAWPIVALIALCGATAFWVVVVTLVFFVTFLTWVIS